MMEDWRETTNWRKQKRILRKMIEELNSKGFFRGCDGKPYRIKNRIFYNAYSRKNLICTEVDGIGMDGKSEHSCSLYYCCPDPLTETEAQQG